MVQTKEDPARELKISERLRSVLRLIENSPDIITRFDREGRHIFVNKTLQGHLGMAKEDIIGKRPIELGVPAETAEVFNATFKQILDTKEHALIEVPWGPMINQAYIVPEMDERGDIVSFAAYSRDITDFKNTEKELRESEAKYRTLVERAHEGIIIVQDGIVKYANPRMAELDGSSVEQLVGTHFTEHVYPSELPKLIDFYRRRMAREKVPSSYETLLRRHNGEAAPAEISAAIVLYQGKPADMVIIHDISAYKRTEEELRRNEYELRSLADNSPDLIIRVNNALQYVYVNSAYERLTGIPKERFIGKTNEELGMPPQLVGFWQQALTRVIESGQEYSMEFEIPSLFGRRCFGTRLIPEFIKSGRVETVLAIARDITERVRAEEQLRYVSFHDKVTGLYNRAYYEEEIRRIDTARTLPVSIIMGDINNLKLVNDVFGHGEGDKLLKAVTESIKKACRSNDIIARWGGDEFAVILPNTGHADAESVRSRIIQIAGAAPGTVIPPSIALGVAVKTTMDQNINQAVRQAEQAMYDDKLARSRQNEELALSSLLQRARERNSDLGIHIERSFGLARRFGKALRLDEEQMRSLLRLIELHDIGIAVIPGEILMKPGRLTKEEWDIVKRHPETGLRIVKSFPDTAKLSDAIFAHDEHWDGTGYPRGLRGRDIPFLARVFNIVETFDVMTNPRPYARTFTREEAVEEIRRNAGKQFDPELVDIFIRKVAENRDVAVPV